MTSQTMAQKLAKTKDINTLWDQVDEVKRLSDGSDLYIYPDGSQLIFSNAGRTNNSGNAHCPHDGICHTSEESCEEAKNRINSIGARP